jgi:hypothetical protein
MFRSCIVTVQTTSVEQNRAHFKADMVYLSPRMAGWDIHKNIII